MVRKRAGVHNFGMLVLQAESAPQHLRPAAARPVRLLTTWLMRRVSMPQNSRLRARVSPMMVERRCPTCISLATFGEEKSTTALL